MRPLQITDTVIAGLQDSLEIESETIPKGELARRGACEETTR
jgi:hypothetical protein